MEEKAEAGLLGLFDLLRIFPDSKAVAAFIDKLTAKHSSRSGFDLARQVVSSTTWKLTGIGVVASLPGAIPGLGTAVQVGLTGASVTGETWLLMRNLAAMQYTIAGLTGHSVFDPERREELIIVWGLATGAIVPAKAAIERVGTKIGIKQFNKRVSGDMLRRINEAVGRTIVTKWGVKRGGIALGRLIPVGVGAVVGGGMNYLAAVGFGTACLKYYCEMLPNDEEVVIPE